MEKQLIEEISDGVATLTFNRPDQLNALSSIDSTCRSPHGPTSRLTRSGSHAGKTASATMDSVWASRGEATDTPMVTDSDPFASMRCARWQRFPAFV